MDDPEYAIGVDFELAVSFERFGAFVVRCGVLLGGGGMDGAGRR